MAYSPAGSSRSAATLHPVLASAAVSPTLSALNDPPSSVTSEVGAPPVVVNDAGRPAIA